VGGVTFEPASASYVAYAINNLAPRVIEYRGRWTDETTLVFDSLGGRPARARVQYVRRPDGTVVFSASEARDGKEHRTYFEAVLKRAARPAPAPSAGAQRLESLARQVMAADYGGDRAELRRLVTALHEVQEPELQAYRGYWEGFAHWRRAINGFNEKPFPPDLKDDLQSAIASFRSAAGDRPDWIEPKIAMAGASAGLLFLTADDPVRHEQVLREFVPSIARWRRRGPRTRARSGSSGAASWAPRRPGGASPRRRRPRSCVEWRRRAARRNDGRKPRTSRPGAGPRT
jgi:hypothetical protein